jgi:hypothetical protein
MADAKDDKNTNPDPDGGAAGGGGADGGDGNAPDPRLEAKSLIKEALKEFAEENKPADDTRHGERKTVGEFLFGKGGILGI